MPRRLNARRIPTNIISGFLGAGKSSAIVHLLAQKPVDEYWAILVNEFGTIGIDGSLIDGNRPDPRGVGLLEVPGGCMCCTASLQLPIALNRLLQRKRPDRLLIEPSGLGHLAEIVATLSGTHYAEVFNLQKIATLVDARNLVDSRYTENPTFRQQIAVADILIGNKRDLYANRDEKTLLTYATRHGVTNAEIYFTVHGALELQWLHGATRAKTVVTATSSTDVIAAEFAEVPIPEAGYLRAVNRGEGFESTGWRFDPSWVFSRARLLAFLRTLAVTRAKAVFITGEGVFGYNYSGDSVMEVELDDCLESRIEIIARKAHSEWHDQLLACLQSADRTAP